MTLQGGAAATCPFCGARLIFRGQTTCQACNRDLSPQAGGPDVLPSSALSGVKITLPSEPEGSSTKPSTPKSASGNAPAKRGPAKRPVEPAPAPEEPEAEAPEEPEEPGEPEEPEEDEQPRKSRGGLFGLFRRRNDDRDDEEAEETGDEDESDDDEPEEDEPTEKLDLDAEIDRQADEIRNAGATTLYGPHGDDVASLLDALNDMDDETASQLADAYEAIPKPEHKVAQSIVRRLRHEVGLDYELSAAEQAVSDWFTGIDFSDEEQDVADTYAVVADAACDAVAGLVLEDELNDVDFATLYGPWSDVMDADEEAAESEEAADAGESEADDVVDAIDSTEAGPVEVEPAADEGVFGPNSALVQQLLDGLDSLTSVKITELVDAWRNQPKEELRLAHRNLQRLADEDPRWHKQLERAQDAVFAWMGDDLTAGPKPTSAREREVAGPAVADAVAALAMADLLEAEDAEILYAPWAETIGEPALPAYEEDDSDGDTADDDQDAAGEEDGGKR